VNGVVTDVKQRRMFSPVSEAESQLIASNVIVIAPSPMSCENTDVSADEMHSVSIKPENITASTSAGVSQTEETADLSGKYEFVEHSVAGSVTATVNASMSQLSLTEDVDIEVEADDAKMQQQTAVKSQLTATAGANIVSDDVSAKDQEVLGTSMQPAAASVQSQQQQQVAVNSQDTEAGSEDLPVETSRDVEDVSSSRVSTYQTDVAVYKQQARSADMADTACCKQETTSGSTSGTYTSCVQLSPSGSDSVFHSPQSDVADSKNTNNNDTGSLTVHQGVQHSVGDTVMAPGETIEIYSRSNSASAGESRETEDKLTQSMAVVEKKPDKDALDHHSEDSKNSERKESLEGGDRVGHDHHGENSKNVESEELLDSEARDSVDDNDDDDDVSEGKEGDTQDQNAADETMDVEPQENKNKASTSWKPKTKRKKKKMEDSKKKKKSNQQCKKSQSATVVDTVKSEADDVASLPIRRPPQSAVSAVDNDAEASGASAAVNHDNSQEASTPDTRNEQKRARGSASNEDTDNAKVCHYLVFYVFL